MLAYPMPEAEQLLADKLAAAQGSLANCDDDLDFLREQITVSFSFPPSSYFPFFARLRSDTDLLSSRQTMEVATARVYNWDVGQRRKEKGGSQDDEVNDSGRPNG